MERDQNVRKRDEDYRAKFETPQLMFERLDRQQDAVKEYEDKLRGAREVVEETRKEIRDRMDRAVEPGPDREKEDA